MNIYQKRLSFQRALAREIIEAVERTGDAAHLIGPSGTAIGSDMTPCSLVIFSTLARPRRVAALARLRARGRP